MFKSLKEFSNEFKKKIINEMNDNVIFIKKEFQFRKY